MNYNRNRKFTIIGLFKSIAWHSKELFHTLFYKQPAYRRSSGRTPEKPVLNIRNVAIAGAIVVALMVVIVVISVSSGAQSTVAASDGAVASSSLQTAPAQTDSPNSALIPPTDKQTDELEPVAVAEKGYIIPRAEIQQASFVPDPELKPGVTHDNVTTLQNRLMELEYMDDDEPTRYYGPATKDAVALFQRNNNLTEDGCAGEKTLTAIYSDSAKPYTISFGVLGTDVEELQGRLKELDYIKTVTGYFGEDTQAAVKEFQNRNGLSADGTVGSQTKEKLFSDNVIGFSLGYGTEGDDVKSLQERLFKLGYMSSADGKYGSETVAAVKRFQTNSGLIADGYVGTTTKNMLFSSDAQVNAFTIGASGADVEKIQNRLSTLKYMSSTTGYYGEKTESAVKAFQKRNGLGQDGKVGSITMSALFSSSAKPAASSGGSPGGGSPNTSKLDKFISVAQSKLGCKYVRGAKGPNSFDCSGFAYYCLNKAGVSQGYLTSYAWRSCSRYTRIKSMSDIRRGDIIIYKMSSSKGHVGIAISSSTMIDASSRNGKVVKRSFRTNYWKGVFYCAYRIF